MTECPNFFRGKKNMFKTDMEVFVIDVNGYDLRRGLIKCFGNNSWTIFYPDSKDVEDIVDTNRIIPYNKDNKRIFNDQEKKRSELHEIKEAIYRNALSADTSPQKRMLEDDLPPKKRIYPNSPTKFLHPLPNTANIAENHVTEQQKIENKSTVVDVNHEIDKKSPIDPSSDNTSTKPDIELHQVQTLKERSSRLDSLQPTSIEFNTNLTKNSYTWTFKINFN
ncbi:hypothetical protein TVAG_323820 [Trichomonas vaginalis G3]|uniref:Uncharacterized protein n=1 Tax=Trichomonas vaginalis (strain ATCC PRA-98 / G3) TaxID=412133 RepID=A2F484_TRIV3|nr:hypothetical protein TVAGG3_1028570 [Trichomonas vaginalis G3]EAY00263.1 hypothetical protein TVAG_323820 [Trichomonas vaginalis G3]KAI5492685.1 hypothetical protein TVAGG3_1028570 [Trichomonas vaginalis G3]|eukprot:XP_001313192.1 hypothetical protein [Trichomonas vaginalis G3]